MNLIGKNFLTLKDFSAEEITYLLELSAELKDKKKRAFRLTIMLVRTLL